MCLRIALGIHDGRTMCPDLSEFRCVQLVCKESGSHSNLDDDGRIINFKKLKKGPAGRYFVSQTARQVRVYPDVWSPYKTWTKSKQQEEYTECIIIIVHHLD
jgi:hypothetical protein